MGEPIWSDKKVLQRIDAIVGEKFPDTSRRPWGYECHAWKALALELRDDMQATIDELTERIDDLMAYYIGVVESKDAQLATLQAAAPVADAEGGEWEPLIDGDYCPMSGNDQYDVKVSDGGYNVSWEKNGYYHRVQEMEFPDDIRLCTRTTTTR